MNVRTLIALVVVSSLLAPAALSSHAGAKTALNEDDLTTDEDLEYDEPDSGEECQEGDNGTLTCDELDGDTETCDPTAENETVCEDGAGEDDAALSCPTEDGLEVEVSNETEDACQEHEDANATAHAEIDRAVEAKPAPPDCRTTDEPGTIECTPPPACEGLIGQTAACTPPAECETDGDGTFTCHLDASSADPASATCRVAEDTERALRCSVPEDCEEGAERAACALPSSCEPDGDTHLCELAEPGQAPQGERACEPDLEAGLLVCTLPEGCQASEDLASRCALPPDCEQVDQHVHECPIPDDVAGLPGSDAAPTRTGHPDAPAPEVREELRAAVENALADFRATLDELRTTYQDEKATLEERYQSSKDELRAAYEVCLDEVPEDASRLEQLETERDCKAQAREDLQQLRAELLAERDVVREDLLGQAHDAKFQTCASLEEPLHGILLDAGHDEGDLAGVLGPEDLGLCTGILVNQTSADIADKGWFGGEGS